MRTLRSVVIIVLVFLVFGYVGQAKKAVWVKRLRLKDAYESGKLSQSDYEAANKDATLSKVLLDPKFVFSVD